MAKKYTVRDGFVLYLPYTNAKGERNERFYDSGETLELDDAEYAANAHKLEYASQKDRDAALAAEKAADVAAKARLAPVDLVQALVAALGQQAQQTPSQPASQPPAP